jgi:transcriptional regulator with XRE-family HTH domain
MRTTPSESRLLATFSNNIRHHRKKLNLSQGDFAKRAGVSRLLVSNIERKASGTGLFTIERFADALGVAASQLLSEQGNAVVALVIPEASTPAVPKAEPAESETVCSSPLESEHSDNADVLDKWPNGDLVVGGTMSRLTALNKRSAVSPNGAAISGAPLSLPRLSSKPTTIDDVVFPSKEAELHIKAWIAGKGKNHLILHGEPGTGKTTLAKLLPALREAGAGPIELRCPRVGDVAGFVESLNRGASTVSLDGHCRYYVLNEFDNLRIDFQRELKPLFEEPYDHVCFIATTNHLDAIDAALANRCVSIHWPTPPFDRALPRLKALARGMGLHISDEVLRTQVYAKSGWRDMNDALAKVAATEPDGC